MDNNRYRILYVVGILALILAGATMFYSLTDDKTPADTTESGMTMQNDDKDIEPKDDVTGISKSEAEKIATDKYGGTVIETEDDDYKGTLVWEIEIRGSKDGRIEVKIDKETGEILDKEMD